MFGEHMFVGWIPYLWAILPGEHMFLQESMGRIANGTGDRPGNRTPGQILDNRIDQPSIVPCPPYRGYADMNLEPSKEHRQYDTYDDAPTLEALQAQVAALQARVAQVQEAKAKARAGQLQAIVDASLAGWDDDTIKAMQAIGPSIPVVFTLALDAQGQAQVSAKVTLDAPPAQKAIGQGRVQSQRHGQVRVAFLPSIPDTMKAALGALGIVEGATYDSLNALWQAAFPGLLTSTGQKAKVGSQVAIRNLAGTGIDPQFAQG